MRFRPRAWISWLGLDGSSKGVAAIQKFETAGGGNAEANIKRSVNDFKDGKAMHWFPETEPRSGMIFTQSTQCH
jgi:hypothetical protein